MVTRLSGAPGWLGRSSIIAINLVIALCVAWVVYEYGHVVREEFLSRQLSIRHGIVAFGFFFVANVLRSVRLHILGIGRRDFLGVLVVGMAHSFVSYMLPARVGEVGLVWFARQILATPTHVSSAVLFSSRFMDVAALVLISIVALLCLRAAGYKDIGPAVAIGLGVLVFGAAIVWVAVAWSKGGRSALHRFVGRVSGEILSHFRKGPLGAALTVSLLIWLCLVGAFYFICLSLGFHIEFEQVVLIPVVSAAISFLPVNGFANVGGHEAAWVFVLAIYGVAQEEAFYLAVGSHVVIFSFVLLVGGVAGIIWLFRVMRAAGRTA